MTACSTAAERASAFRAMPDYNGETQEGMGDDALLDQRRVSG
jgi:hypothetical protein